MAKIGKLYLIILLIILIFGFCFRYLGKKEKGPELEINIPETILPLIP